MNRQLADFGQPTGLPQGESRFGGGAGGRISQGVNGLAGGVQAGAHGGGLGGEGENMLLRSTNEDMMSQYTSRTDSLPSNNFQSAATLYRESLPVVQQMSHQQSVRNPFEHDPSSSEFSSVMRSNRLGIPASEAGGVPIASQAQYTQEQTSYIESVADSYQSAELNAMTQEHLAKKRREEQEQKLAQFQSKTKANAMRKMREQTEQKKKEQNEKKAKALENAQRMKEFAQKQREIVSKQRTGSARGPRQPSGSKNQSGTYNSTATGTPSQKQRPGSAKGPKASLPSQQQQEEALLGQGQSHAEMVRSHRNLASQRSGKPQPIQELSDEELSSKQSSAKPPKGSKVMPRAGLPKPPTAISSKPPAVKGLGAKSGSQNRVGFALNLPPQHSQRSLHRGDDLELIPPNSAHTAKTLPADKQALVDIYHRVDQDELDKTGLGLKSEMPPTSLKSVFQFTMLQRFRQNKDFKAPDTSRPKAHNKEELKEMREKEHEWFRQNATTEEQKETSKKQSVEKGRYIQALKAMVQEKGKKMNPNHPTVPSLCSCGALSENVRVLSKSRSMGTSPSKAVADPGIQMCASNCQFYRNDKGYVRALRDVMHSMDYFAGKH